MNVRRKQIFVDSFHQIHPRTKEEMQGGIRIKFIGERGTDVGGLKREWFLLLSKAILDPGYALFMDTKNGNNMQPNPNSGQLTPEHLDYFKFVGRIVGKAL